MRCNLVTREEGATQFCVYFNNSDKTEKKTNFMPAGKRNVEDFTGKIHTFLCFQRNLKGNPLLRKVRNV